MRTLFVFKINVGQFYLLEFKYCLFYECFSYGLFFAGDSATSISGGAWEGQNLNRPPPFPGCNFKLDKHYHSNLYTKAMAVY